MAGQIPPRPRLTNPRLQSTNPDMAKNNTPSMTTGSQTPATPANTPPVAILPTPVGTSRRRWHISTRGVVIIVLILTFAGCIIGIIQSGSLRNIILDVSTVGAFLAGIFFALVRKREINDFFVGCDTFFGGILTSSGASLSGVFTAIGTALKRLVGSKLVSILSLLLNIVLIFIIIHPWTLLIPPHRILGATQIASCVGKDICVRMINKEPIGISDGQQDFLGSSNHQHAFWTTRDTNNAEQAIYAENKTITDNFVTLVVLTTLSPGVEEVNGNDDLQGVNTLQREVNAGGCTLPGCRKLRVLVANGGDDYQYSDIVAQQVVTLAHKEPVVGVVGFSLSTSGAVAGIHILSANHILMISPSASSDALTAISPYFFRVVPPDSQQGAVAAQYAPASTKIAVIFYADNNLYSTTLASSFGNVLKKKVSQVSYETYQRIADQAKRNAEYDQIGEEWNQVQHQRPDLNLVFCACYVDDLNALLQNLRNPQSQLPHPINVMGGDAAYDPGGFPNSSNYHDLTFTAFGFPDEWGVKDVSKECLDNTSDKAQNFSCDYANNFDPERKHMGAYGYTRADASVITAFDSARVLLLAYKAATDNIGNGVPNADVPNADNTQQALFGNDECKEFQGISGRIVFGRDGNPVEKAVVILTVDKSRLTHILNGAWQTQLKASDTACYLFL